MFSDGQIERQPLFKHDKSKSCTYRWAVQKTNKYMTKKRFPTQKIKIID